MIHELRERLRSLGADIVSCRKVLDSTVATPRVSRLAGGAPVRISRRQHVDRLAYGATPSTLTAITQPRFSAAIRSAGPRTRTSRSTRARTRPPALRDRSSRRALAPALHLRSPGAQRARPAPSGGRADRAVAPRGARARAAVVAGDFNDWRNLAGKRLAAALDLREALADRWGRPARSFPSAFPVLRLDRIYVRGSRSRARRLTAAGRGAHFGPRGAVGDLRFARRSRRRRALIVVPAVVE